MSLSEVIVVALATWEIVEIWHHSSLMASWRAKVEVWDEGVKGFLADLLACPFCLSVWVAFAGVLMILLPRLCWWLGFLPVIPCGFAVARLANLGNDLCHAWCRTPRHNKLEIPQDVVPDEAEE